MSRAAKHLQCQENYIGLYILGGHCQRRSEYIHVILCLVYYTFEVPIISVITSILVAKPLYVITVKSRL